uniref:Polysaccharide pyruvyl transferase domain-containing protein n=1 Tax=Arion vulgaris TaxID=1028688 RepID=A0A0B7B6N4_9EUPU
MLASLLVSSCLLTTNYGSHLITRQTFPFVQTRETIKEYTEHLPNLRFDPIIDLTFGGNSFKRPDTSDLLPDLNGYLEMENANITEFLNRQFINDPTGVNYLSKQLKTSLEVIKEAQRIHYNLFQDILGKYKYCILLDIADFENKGDPAITVGEIYYLSRINLTILFYCSSYVCTDSMLEKALVIARKHSPNELVILIHGGGSIIGYIERDEFRFKILKMFKGFHLFVFPQSIWKHKLIPAAHFQLCKTSYCCNENLTFVIRDSASYSMAKQYFNGTTKLLMAPDMAFHIGPIKRFISPVFDILWLRRQDQETGRYNITKKFPPHLRVHVTDWNNFRTPQAGTSLEKAFYATVMGTFFVQRGRVVITDRLHGHIFSTLMDIPHVLLDNQWKKVSSYHNTWTLGLENTRLTDNADEAIKYALELLEIYDQVLPPRIKLMTPNVKVKNNTLTLLDSSYP